MIYLDTSVVVPLFIPEPASEAIETWFANCDDKFISSDWLITEFASALSIKVRRAEINKKQADTAWNNFETLTKTGIHLMRASASAFNAAANLTRISSSGLRAGDALHLAIAMEAKALEFSTADKNLARNAKAHGLLVTKF